MQSLDEVQRLEVKVGDSWVPIHMEQLEAGDVFRLIDIDGSLVQHDGKTEFIAQNDPTIDIKVG